MFDSTSNEEFSEMLVAGGPDEEERLAAADSSPNVPIIAFSDVGISFDGRVVLEDVSFSMNRGQTLCILGRSGVGKSVALRMLMGFLKPDMGSIRVEGQEITDLDEEGMRAFASASPWSFRTARSSTL